MIAETVFERDPSSRLCRGAPALSVSFTLRSFALSAGLDCRRVKEALRLASCGFEQRLRLFRARVCYICNKASHDCPVMGPKRVFSACAMADLSGRGSARRGGRLGFPALLRRGYRL